MRKWLHAFLGYWALSLLVMYFFAGAGDGSYVPIAVLSSWTALLIRPAIRLLSIGKNETVLLLLVFSALFFLYQLVRAIFTILLSQSGKRSFAYVPEIVHYMGAVVVLMDLPIASKVPGLGQGATYFLISYLVSALLAFWYYFLDRHLIKLIGERRQRA